MKQAVTFSLVTALVACGSVQSYPLTPPSQGARASFPALVACAQERQHQVSEHSESVNVEVEPSTWVQYMDNGSSFDMVVVGASDSQQSSRAKAEGDAIYGCAQARLKPAATPGGPDLGGALGAIGEGLSASAVCTQATTCFTALTLTACKGAIDETCMRDLNKAHNSQSGTTAEGCALSISAMVKAVEPHAAGFVPPPACANAPR